MKNQLESLLFIVGKSLDLHECARFFGIDQISMQKIFDELADDYVTQDRGMCISKIEHGNRITYQMVTAPENSDSVKRFTKQDVTGELTRPAAETLSIIAYRGPISKPELEKIRGVNCSLILRNLMIRGLIDEGKSSVTGENTFMVTQDFIHWLGMTTVGSLPDYDRLHTEELSILSDNVQKI